MQKLAHISLYLCIERKGVTMSIKPGNDAFIAAFLRKILHIHITHLVVDKNLTSIPPLLAHVGQDSRLLYEIVEIYVDEDCVFFKKLSVLCNSQACKTAPHGFLYHKTA